MIMKHTIAPLFCKFRNWTALLLLCLLTVPALGQDRIQQLGIQLENRIPNQPGLGETVNFSVSGASLQDFIRGIASVHNLNVSVNSNVKGKVVNTFSNARVVDVFVFLCREYELDITFTGSIMSFHNYEPLPETKTFVRKLPQVEYNGTNDFLSLNLKRDSMDAVAEQITKLSAKNVILAPDIKYDRVSVFIQNRPFDNALEKFALANGLRVTRTDDNFYFIERDPELVAQTGNPNARNNRQQPSTPKSNNFKLDVGEGGLLTVDARNTPIVDILSAVSHELHKNFFMFNEPTGNTSLYVENATYDEFLSHLLNGTEFTFRNQEEVYLIGKRNLEGLRTTELIQMENRTVESIIDYIPAELKTDVEIKEFIELNGLIVSGSYPRIEEIKQFMRQVDQVVPMVLVEVIIVDVNRSRAIKTGISAGIGGDGSATTGTYNNDGLNTTMNAGTINNLINSFNGFGLVNLGNVNQDFYLSIQALETDRIIRLRSTPRLSTLNGHEATLKIGKTEYYAETSSTAIGNENPSFIASTVFKTTNADLSITIKPTVSQGEYVTMNIQVDQSDFDEESVPGQPRGTFNRSFQSIIRAKNGDMILLGGLEEKSSGKSGSGLPLISRIPILKWIFGQRALSKSKTQLNIFIKPTIIY